MGSKITKERSGKEVRSRKKPANLMPRLKEAAKLLVRNCEKGFDDDTLCAKSHEVTARLLSQCCIIGLRQAKGWNNADIAEALIEKGSHASRDMIGQWLAGKTTPKPDRLANLDDLYRDTPNYKRGRMASARY